jgi:HK97 family phage prohead protease
MTMNSPGNAHITPADAASCLPRKTFECEFKSLDDNGTFTLYALVFGNVDRQFDVIEPGAVTNCDELVKDGWIAINHVGVDLPVAVINSAAQDAHGLLLTGSFHSTLRAQECRTIVVERMAAGKAVKTSIGYMVLDGGERFETVDGKTVRYLSAIAVFETSFVNLPANPAAEVIAAKSVQSLPIAEPESLEMAKDKAIIESIKQALGLATKTSYKVDGEALEKCKGLVDKCATSAQSLDDMHKSMKGFIDAHKAATDELTKAMKNFQSGQPQDVAADDDGPVADDPKKPAAADAAKDDDDDKDDDDEDAKTAKAYRDQLKRRASSGRRSQTCP